mmetsp:Transcript_48504/g.149847  ORF Transcript_48504/g.149847 Transcript_48504/m.149847 type:complete len:400 (+) Transcript_48504:71-1270(+)
MFDFDGLDEAEDGPGGAEQTNGLAKTAAGGKAGTPDAVGPETSDSVPTADAATRKGAQLLQAAQRRSAGQEAGPSVAPSGGTSSTAPAARDKRVHWKVVRTIDAGGIAVRSDGPHSTGGRLQLHSVVMEKERRGNDLRYEAISGRSWGPRSGWVKIESKGTAWLECQGANGAEAIVQGPATSAQQLKALVIFDWDDTLCPTSWIEECPQLLNALEGQVSRTGEAWELLCEQARTVRELLERAASLASMALVTLAERPWVAVSVKDFLPEAESVTQHEVFYARELAMARSPPGACPLTAMKRRAMQNAIETMIAKCGQGTTWESFISIGDSEVEKRAAQDLGREFQNKGVFKYTKTVKMLEHPHVRQLTAQCRTLHERLREFVNFPGHRQITHAELLRSR